MKTSSFAATAALLTALALGLAVLMMGTVLAMPAFAHTALRSSDPEQHATVESLTKVTLRFTDQVRLPAVVVRGPDGVAYQTGVPETDGPIVTQNVRGPLPAGAYTLAYRVVSADGHPVQGQIPFTVTAPSSPDPSSPRSASPASSPSTNAGQAEDTGQTAAAPADGADAVTGGVAEAEEPSGLIPGWAFAVVFGLAGVGIGLAISLRPKKARGTSGAASGTRQAAEAQQPSDDRPASESNPKKRP
ncbi:MAG TPA: copper resistance CopC family protein [Thermopolyspora sp.]|jgi:Uncharacterized protein, homolog of Cu resistance protein CopC